MNNKRIRDYLKLLLAVNAIIGVKTESRKVVPEKVVPEKSRGKLHFAIFC